MEQADELILGGLKLLNIKQPHKSIGELQEEGFVQLLCKVLSLHQEEADLEKLNVVQRFKLCQRIVDALKSRNYSGQLSVQLLLCPDIKSVREILTFLVTSSPSSSYRASGTLNVSAKFLDGFPDYQRIVLASRYYLEQSRSGPGYHNAQIVDHHFTSLEVPTLPNDSPDSKSSTKINKSEKLQYSTKEKEIHLNKKEQNQPANHSGSCIKENIADMEAVYQQEIESGKDRALAEAVSNLEIVVKNQKKLIRARKLASEMAKKDVSFVSIGDV
ncbi:hypothetical protein Ciccas_001602 [Cichlidogyrus casuarinus]|uniref:CCDC22 N-terminal domain-containing protein n=1 Tax=Cichlidogyrus casuarinus TaxID=1844966 RepID=A0ABD2QKT0_9PLAT